MAVCVAIISPQRAMGWINRMPASPQATNSPDQRKVHTIGVGQRWGRAGAKPATLKPGQSREPNAFLDCHLEDKCGRDTSP
ncbi:hypothetical protein INR49_007698 [Caranx melampygus]|nr:hypothetical protein INR49_007698 [Caranx melampygus]